MVGHSHYDPGREGASQCCARCNTRQPSPAMIPGIARDTTSRSIAQHDEPVDAGASAVGEWLRSGHGPPWHPAVHEDTV